MENNLTKLLKARRFLPLFLTQALEALNDSLLKNALIILITYKLVTSTSGAESLTALAGGIFIVPYLIFSAIAGQLADKFDKAVLIRIIKVVEILAMLLATVGFLYSSISVLMFSLFLMGVHSAFFGPLKYAIIPDHLQENELIAGNALIEASTFLAILLGTILGIELIGLHLGHLIVSISGVCIACAGLLCSFFIPSARRSSQPDLKISYRFVKATIDIVKDSMENRKVFFSILGVSWFWLFGAVLLLVYPTFAKSVLDADRQTITLFFTLFSVGIAVGSLLCDRLQRGEVNAKYVPLGALGMSIFVIDLFFAGNSFNASGNTQLFGLGQLLTSFSYWRILVDTFFISVCGGIFIVPLYAMMQNLAKQSHRSRIIAVSNILGAAFMVVASLGVHLLAAMNVAVPDTFLILGILNLVVTIYVCKLLPDAVIKSFVRWLLKLLYKVEVKGLDYYREAGDRILIIANHVSFLDAILLSAFLPAKVMFAINSYVAKQWWMKPFLPFINAFPLDPTNPMSTKSLIKKMKENYHCIIFPEGRLTVTGALMKVYEGPAMIADKSGANLLPVRIDGAQYSPFSRLKGKVKIKWFPKITITILPHRKIDLPVETPARNRREITSARLYSLMVDLMFESSEYKKTLFQSLIDAGKIHGKKHSIIEGIDRKQLTYRQLIMRSLMLGRVIFKQTSEGESPGLLLPNSVNTVVAFFAILSHGRVPAMLNFSTGDINILSACKTAQIRTVYTSSQFIQRAKLDSLIEALESEGIKIIYLEDLVKKLTLTDKLTGFFAGCFPGFYYKKHCSGLNSSDAAVILFTSGSEGTPKGVVLSHENIQANRFQMTSKIDLSEKDVVFNALPLFHSLALMGGTLMPILSGVKVFFYPSPLHYRIIPELIYDTNATILFGTDAFLTSYANFAHPYDFYSLRYVFAGAEKLKDETKKLWSDKFGIRIFEGYGTTETSPVIAINTPMQCKPGSVGCILPKISCRLEKVPGIESGGRLLVKGPNIMKGYLKFDNPGVLVPPEDGWHDTGDIVDVDPIGYVTIKGRAKRFAKIAGEMISLTAVESYFSGIWPENKHAVVAVPDEKKGELLVLVTENHSITLELIIKHFQELGIGTINIPKKIIYLDSMYLLSTGKTDYVKIREMVGKTST